MPGEQNERRPSKPPFPRLDAAEAERVATRFNPIHTRWQPEGSLPPARQAAIAPTRGEALINNTSVLVTPIVNIDGPAERASPAMALEAFEPPALLAQPLEGTVPAAEDTEPAVQGVAAFVQDAATSMQNAETSLEPFGAASDDGSPAGETHATSTHADLLESLSRAKAVQDVTPAPPASNDDLLSPNQGQTVPRPLLDSAQPSPAAATNWLPEAARQPRRTQLEDAIDARPSSDDDHDAPELARLRPKHRWRWLLAVASLAVAGASIYRTLYFGKRPPADTAAALVPAAVSKPPVAPVQDLLHTPVSSADLTVPAPASAVSEPKPQAMPPQATSIPSPETKAPAKGAKAPARKAGPETADTLDGSTSAKRTSKQTSPGRRKLSAKPRKPPQKKVRSGIIRKSPL